MMIWKMWDSLFHQLLTHSISTSLIFLVLCLILSHILRNPTNFLSQSLPLYTWNWWIWSILQNNISNQTVTLWGIFGLGTDSLYWWYWTISIYRYHHQFWKSSFKIRWYGIQCNTEQATEILYRILWGEKYSKLAIKLLTELDIIHIIQQNAPLTVFFEVKNLSFLISVHPFSK